MASSASREEIIKYLFEAQQIGIDEVIKLLEGTKQKSEEAGNAFTFLKEHMAEIISVATAVEIALKGIEFGKESVANAEAVETSLSRVRALAGGAAVAFSEMEEAVDKAGQAVNVSSQESASGLAALVSTGLSAKDAITALIPTLQLAKIAQIDVGTAAQEVAQTLSAFNLPASQAQSVVDQLTAASHGAAGGLGAMSDAARQLAPDAQQLHLSFTDTVSVLGMLAEKGFDVEKSTKGLRTIFQELENPTSKLREELLALGDGTNDFGTAVTALNGNMPRAREALLSLSGPSRTIVELLGQAGPGALAAFNAKLQETGGLAERTAKVLDDNLGGASKKFELAIEGIGEKLAKPVLTPFKDELEKLAAELNKFADSPDFKEIEQEIGEMARNAARALDGFVHGIDWKTFLTDGKDALGQIGDKLKDLADNAASIASAINKTFETVGLAYHTAATGVDLVVAGAAKAADAVVSVQEKTGALLISATGAKDKIESMHNALVSIGDSAVERAVENVDALSKNASALADSQGRAAQETNKTAAATRQHGEAAAVTAPQLDKYQEAEQRLAKAADDAATVLPTMTVRLGQAGIASQSFANDLDKAYAAARRMADGAQDLDTAFKTLGLKSQQSLEQAAVAAATAFGEIDKSAANTASGLADRQNAFLAYAKAALAASAQLDIGTRSSIQYQLESRASVLGVTSALADLEQQSSHSQAALTSDADRSAAALDAEAEAARRAARAFSGDGGGASGAPPLDEATKRANAEIHKYGDDGGESLAKLDEALGATRASFLNVSEAAAKAFDDRLVGDFASALDSAGNGALGFSRTIIAMNQAAAETAAQIANDRTQLQGMVGDINAVGAAGDKGFGQFGTDAATASARINDLINAVKDGNYQVGILGQQDLAPLLQALEAAKQRADAAAQAAAQAAGEFDNLAKSIHDQLLQAQGDEKALEDERHQEQLAKLKELADAGQIDQAKYQQAVADENALHDLKMRHLQEQQQQNSGGSSGNGSGGGTSKPTTTSGSNVGGGNGGGQPGAATSVAGNGATTTKSLGSGLGDVHIGAVNFTLTKSPHDYTDEEVNAFAHRAGAAMTQVVIDQLRWARGMA